MVKAVSVRATMAAGMLTSWVSRREILHGEGVKFYIVRRSHPRELRGDQPGAPNYEGLFESHVTVEAPDVGSLDRFRATCASLGVKGVLIVLPRGIARSQPMANSIHRGTFPQARLEAGDLAGDCKARASPSSASRSRRHPATPTSPRPTTGRGPSRRATTSSIMKADSQIKRSATTRKKSLFPSQEPLRCQCHLISKTEKCHVRTEVLSGAVKSLTDERKDSAIVRIDELVGVR